jgi:hypothetical protein
MRNTPKHHTTRGLLPIHTAHRGMGGPQLNGKPQRTGICTFYIAPPYKRYTLAQNKHVGIFTTYSYFFEIFLVKYLKIHPLYYLHY